METLQTVNNNNYEFHRVYQKINGGEKNQKHQQSSNSLIETQSDEQSDGAISLVAWLTKKEQRTHFFNLIFLRLIFQTIPFCITRIQC